MNEKLNIEQLFSTKLEGLEQTPSTAVWERTSRMVRRKQFLRFNYRRFNIYYTAGLIILGAALTYALISKDSKELETPGTIDHQTTDQLHNEMPGQDRDQYINQDDLQSKLSDKAEQYPANKMVNSGNESEQGSGTKFSDEPGQLKNHTGEYLESGSTTDNQPLKPVSTLVPYFTLSVYEGCAPLTVEFRSASINATELSWNFGTSNPVSDSTDVVVTYTAPGTYTVTMTAMDQHGMQKSHSETIIVHPKPQAAFEMDQVSIYNYSVDANEFEWYLISGKMRITDMSDFEPFSTNFQPNLSRIIENVKPSNLLDPTLLLVVKNNFGCTDSTSGLLPQGNDPSLVFPTAFSPNPNGSIGGYYNPNDPDNLVFHPNFEEVPESYHLRIFNKSGTLVFETKDIYVGWDGYYQETRAPRGVYIYSCTGKWKNGHPFQYRGDITILWNDQ